MLGPCNASVLAGVCRKLHGRGGLELWTSWCCTQFIVLRGRLGHPVPAAEDVWWRVDSCCSVPLTECVLTAEGNPVVKRGSELEVTEEKGAAHKGEASKPAASKVRQGAWWPLERVQSAV